MWVKICGIRDVSTAESVAALNPAAIGLNFYAPSPRSISADTAREIIRAIAGSSVQPVGLFVNESLDTISKLVESCHFPCVQLHGDEPPELMAALQQRFPDLQIIRAWRMGQDGLSGLKIHLQTCQEHGFSPWACLVDSHVHGSYGGTGTRVNWKELSHSYPTRDWPKLILAGGLTPGNVPEAIAQVRPFGVDVASGVESAPGIKDLSAVRRLIENSRTPLKHSQNG